MTKISEKTNRIIYWILTALIAFVFIGSAIGKLTANEEALKMATNFGLDAKTFSIIGVVELICVLLFIIPRTGVIGTLLLAAYMGGAIATHLEHGESVIAPCVIQAFIFMAALYRFPELRKTLLNSKS
jgi:uncharacterized membrane protein YphA (DoxX/SURF4 family)